ncbi:MAG: hypothetical protein AAF577_09380 [Pseudomonadota bacterium]
MSTPSGAALGAEPASPADLTNRLDTLLQSDAARRALGVVTELPAEPSAPSPSPSPPTPARSAESRDGVPADTPSQERPDEETTQNLLSTRSGAAAHIACLPASPGDGIGRVVVGTTEQDARMLDALATVERDARGGDAEGIAARERIAEIEARQRLAERVVRRQVAAPLGQPLAVVFDDVLVDCGFVVAVEGVLARWLSVDGPAIDPSVGDASGAMPASTPAWAELRDRLLDAPQALRHTLAGRIAEVLALSGRLRPLLLLEPMLPPPGAKPNGRLVAAHLELVHDRADAGRAALAQIVREDAHAGQIAAVLLAERLDPLEDMPLSMGWLGHLDLVGAIAFEHAGSPFGRRAARAEVGLTARVLGRAAALRALSLSHDRGFLDEVEVERLAAMLWAVEEMPADPLPLPLWAMAEPDSFAALPGGAGRGDAPRRRGSDATSCGAARSGEDVAARGGGVAAPPDWRGRISVPGSGGSDTAGAEDAPATLTDAGAAAAAADAETTAGARPGAASGADVDAAALDALLEQARRGQGAGSEAASGQADVLAETEQLLRRIGDDMDAAEALLTDG